jgi:hypothetical protein
MVRVREQGWGQGGNSEGEGVRVSCDITTQIKKTSTQSLDNTTSLVLQLVKPMFFLIF